MLCLYRAVALSPTITFTDRDAPSHGRLARTSSVDEMRVSWTSTEGTCTDCLVQWGLTSEKLDPDRCCILVSSGILRHANTPTLVVRPSLAFAFRHSDRTNYE